MCSCVFSCTQQQQKLQGQDKNPAFMIWGNRDGVSNGISEIALAYTRDEEKVLGRNLYTVSPLFRCSNAKVIILTKPCIDRLLLQ